MAQAHLIFGVVAFLVFLITGQFMLADFPDKENMSQELRVLMRSRHIYILFGSFLHILLGLYIRVNETRWKKALQIAGSVFAFLSVIFLISGFISETYYLKTYTNASRFGIYSALAAIIFHFIGGFQFRKSNEN